MADRTGKYWANVTTGTKAQQAPGHSNNAAMRRNREVFLTDDGGANAIGTTLVIGVLRGGDVPDKVEITAGTVAMSGVSFSLGTRANATKYSAAIAGPGAGATVTIKFLDVNDIGLNTVPFASEELVLTTSVAVIPVTAGGKLQVDTYYSHK
ncbi:hypothetical protein [Novosphingobium sp. FKTRR1]|uniref:hypothetical protein n=1 Tax=Novosphingobium sp. FKTRR1 TaxID=2879118 RepID=UPI001CF0963C|nr:hypothetical protein [Novosphingobium sp. FKTRR1]